MLLDDQRVDEALQIARSFLETTVDGSLDYKRILRRAVLIVLHKNELLVARELLLESGIAPEDILQFCPDLIQGTLMEKGTNRELSPLIIELFASNEQVIITKRNHFLLEYLAEFRRSSAEDFSQVP